MYHVRSAPRCGLLFAAFMFLALVGTHSQWSGDRIQPGDCSAISTNPAIVIEGKGSLVASYDGNGQYTAILHTSDTAIPLARGKTYVATFRYRVLEAPDKGFEALFWSPTAGRLNQWLPSYRFSGSKGDTGDATLTSTLGPYDDYVFQLNIVGKGAIAVDTVAIKEGTEPGVVVLSEDFEEHAPLAAAPATPPAQTVAAPPAATTPSPAASSLAPITTFMPPPPLVQGKFPFTVDDPVETALGSDGLTYTLRAVGAWDLDGDGKREVPMTFTTYPEQVPLPVRIFGNKGAAADLTRRFFPAGTPTVRHSPYIMFADLDRDGRDDIVFSEAGLDHPPWTGARIVIALRNPDGTYRDVSDRIPAEFQGTRCYALGVGDMDGNGIPDILIPDQLHGTDNCILTWKDGRFQAKRNWIFEELWRHPAKLYASNSLAVADMDGDGFADIVAGGGWERPNIRIMYGSRTGYREENLKTLPDGIFGHTEWAEWEKLTACQGTDSLGTLPLDLDNDGDLDLFLMEEQVLAFKPEFGKGSVDNFIGDDKEHGGTVYANCAFRVLVNKGARAWREADPDPARNVLGWRGYISLVPMDLDLDGFVDIVGGYWTKRTSTQRGGLFGTTFFLNDGTGSFRAVEAPGILPTFDTSQGYPVQQLGIFMPTLISDAGMEGLFARSYNFGGQATLLVYRASTTARFGTGPGFADSAALGFPGFNESYYLRAHPDAASSVLAGQFASGLEHYRNVGLRRGYQTFAANATVRGTPGKDTLTLAIRKSDAKLTKAGDAWKLSDRSGRYGTLTLVGIETVAFLDGEAAIRP